MKRLLHSTCALVLVAVGAMDCGNNASTGSGGASGASSGSGSGAAVSSSTGGMAMGDPCRGTPLPTDQHYVPSGLCARLVASGVGGLREITFAPNGDLFGVTNGGSIRLFHDANGDGQFDGGEVSEFANTGGNGNNCHIDVAGGYLYAGSPDGVKRWPYAPGTMSGGAGEDVIIGQPSSGGHTKHTVHIYDGYLYVHSGSSGNATNPMSPKYDTDRSLLRRFELSKFDPTSPFQWLSGEVYSAGIRNMVGYTRNAAGRMFGVVNGLDGVHYQGSDVHNDNPGEQVLELGLGKNFGYPFCFTAQRVVVGNQVVLPNTQLFNEDFQSGHDDAWCAANSTPPATFVQAHSAPLDITFFDTAPIGGLPEEWRGGAFISLHGSWNRAPATGYKVVWVPFDKNGNPPIPTSDMNTTTFPYKTVFGRGDTSGPVDGSWSWNNGTTGESPRPVGVAVSPIDGALYISSDASGMVYRVGIQH